MNNSISSKALFLQIQGELKSLYSVEESQAITSLVLHYLFGLKKTDIISDRTINTFNNEAREKLYKILKRLKNAEPIQYIFGETEFYGLKIRVNPSVLIPRQETEELVDLVIKENTGKKGLKVLDICTGSGCIAIALNKHLDDISSFAIDISSEALKTAVINAQINNAVIDFQHSDALRENFPWNISFDIIISNPPYIEKSEMSLMHKNVLDFEPSIALFVEDLDPLIFYKRIMELAAKALNPYGKLYFEINEKFGEEIKNLFLSKGFSEVKIIKDLSGKDRIAKAVFADADKSTK